MKQLILIGDPVGHSLSPLMHNAALREMSLDMEFRYEARPTRFDELESQAISIRNGMIEGANITVPYKREIMRFLDEVSKVASVVGSVNTLYREGDRVHGNNTDVSGFLKSLREKAITLNGKRATILGAGGAARSVAYALIQSRVARLDILNRTLANAIELATSLRNQATCELHVWEDPTSFDFDKTDLVVNCTPIGMHGHSISQSPLDGIDLHSELTVVDLVYNPRRTKLLLDAEVAGCLTIDGTGMLVHQGAESLELWVGEKPPIEVMRSAVLDALGG
ncbi:MAG: shikimate dehydrogenase [Candidatus Thorarchaeota archaeon]